VGHPPPRSPTKKAAVTYSRALFATSRAGCLRLPGYLAPDEVVGGVPAGDGDDVGVSEAVRGDYASLVEDLRTKGGRLRDQAEGDHQMRLAAAHGLGERVDGLEAALSKYLDRINGNVRLSFAVSSTA
jgi:hypothetical protein